MLFTLRMGLMGLHFIVAGILGLLLGICRPFNPDNSRLCARLYSMPALRILRLNLSRDAKGLLEHQRSCVIIANHQSNYDLYVLGRVVPKRTVSIGKKSLKWVPFFGQLYWLAGNVLIERGNAKQAKQAEYRQCAERVMAFATPLPGQVSLDLARRRKELGKAGIGRADQPPDQAKDEQADDEQPNPAVPVDPLASHLTADDRSRHAQDERPVKKAGGQIPETNTFAVHRHIFDC